MAVCLIPHGALRLEAQTPPAPKPVPLNPDPLNRDTPQKSVFNFLEACRAKNYQRAWRYLDLHNLNDDSRASEGPQLACSNWSGFSTATSRFDVASLSTKPDGEGAGGLAPDLELVDTFNVDGRPQQLLLERAKLRSGQQVWLFSPESIGIIP